MYEASVIVTGGDSVCKAGVALACRVIVYLLYSATLPLRPRLRSRPESISLTTDRLCG